MSDLIMGAVSSSNQYHSEPKVSENSKINEAASLDSISQIVSSPEHAASKTRSTDPLLPPPSKPPISLWKFLDIIGDAKLNLQQVIQKTELLKFAKELQIPPCTPLSQQSQAILTTADNIEEAENQVQLQTTALMEKLTEAFDDINEVIDTQNEAIKKLVEGNQQQQEQFEDLIDAHETYVKGLEALGATSDGNGVFTIPDNPEAQAEYERLTAEYQTSVNTFNQYWSMRLEEINQYNTSTKDYNSKVVEINQELTENLGPYVDEVPQLQPVPLVIISASGPVPSPEVREANQVYIPSLPAYVNQLATQNLTQINTLTIMTFNRTLIEKNIHDYLTETLVDPLNDQLDAQMDVYSFQLFLMRQANLRAEEADPVVERKLFSQLLLPDSAITSEKKDIAPGSMKPENWNAHSNLAKILAADILQLFLDQNHQGVQITSGSLFKLALLSMDQLSKSSNDALISILRKMGAALTELPKDSPIFTLLLTLSFANNFLAQVKNGSLEQKISLQIAGISELNQLTPQEKKSLTAILKANQLLILGRFMEGHLGLTGFSNSLLAQISPAEATKILGQIEQANQQTNNDQLVASKALWIKQGLSEEKAQFLAEMGVNALAKGWLMAPSVSTVSASLVNLSLLIDSVTAGLILSPEQSLSLNECGSIAETAVQSLLSENIPRSAASFRKALQAELNEMGMYKFSAGASNRALLIPNSSLRPENYFQALLGSQLGNNASKEFQSEVNLLFKELPSTLLNELKNLPENVQNALLESSMQNSLSLHSFLATFSNPAAVLMSSISSMQEIKINKDLYA